MSEEMLKKLTVETLLKTRSRSFFCQSDSGSVRTIIEIEKPQWKKRNLCFWLWACVRFSASSWGSPDFQRPADSNQSVCDINMYAKSICMRYQCDSTHFPNLHNTVKYNTKFTHLPTGSPPPRPWKRARSRTSESPACRWRFSIPASPNTASLPRSASSWSCSRGRRSSHHKQHRIRGRGGYTCQYFFGFYKFSTLFFYIFENTIFFFTSFPLPLVLLQEHLPYFAGSCHAFPLENAVLVADPAILIEPANHPKIEPPPSPLPRIISRQNGDVGPEKIISNFISFDIIFEFHSKV
jgi:hypothetical protein